MSAKADTVDSKAALKDLWAEIESKSNSDFMGLSTGLDSLDYKLGGMVAGDLILIAARPSMGKTAFMLNIAKNAPCPVGIFSLEMPTAKLMARLISSCGVDHGKLKHPKELTDADRQAMSRASTEIIESDIFINDIGGLALPALESEARRMVKKHGVGLICIDYLQLVTCKAEKRLEVVSEVSRRLKALAKNLGVPVIALSQLNRQVENTINPVPSLAHLRESGQLEQDADIVIFIDRPEQRDSANRPGEADLIIGKNRDGEIGMVRVAWQGRYQRFTNLAGGWGETVDHGFKRTAA
jgi:replicative DNA helicase